MVMEDILFIGDFLIETPISRGFPIVTFDYRMVYEWKLSVNNGELMAIMGYHGIQCRNINLYLPSWDISGNHGPFTYAKR